MIPPRAVSATGDVAAAITAALVTALCHSVGAAQSSQPPPKEVVIGASIPWPALGTGNGSTIQEPRTSVRAASARRSDERAESAV